MPTRNISLTKQQDVYIEQAVKSGRYQNASEAMRAAIRALQQREREDKVKLRELRAAIKEGLDASARGDVDHVEIGQIGNYLRSLTAGVRKRPR